jgi:uncharacterized OB-fold protein
MPAAIIDAELPRMLPPLTPENRAFWTGGGRGQLLIQRCVECQRWVHPPTGHCPACGGSLRAEPVAGTGTIFTYTVNHQQFVPEVPPPNLIAIVELDEQADLRIPTNIVHCDAEALRIGLAVRVLFERHGEIFYPVFEPAESEA